MVLDRSILSALEDGDEDLLELLPEWQVEELEIAREVTHDSGERFVERPSKFKFHEYRHMENFIVSLDESPGTDHLLQAIRGKGAFRRLKDSAACLGLLEKWYRYREEAME